MKSLRQWGSSGLLELPEGDPRKFHPLGDFEWKSIIRRHKTLKTDFGKSTPDKNNKKYKETNSELQLNMEETQKEHLGIEGKGRQNYCSLFWIEENNAILCNTAREGREATITFTPSGSQLEKCPQSILNISVKKQTLGEPEKSYWE